jgi:HAD superfamily hydrolase (TIGR01509 family)
LRTPPRPLRAVLFDWDGTIVDSAEASFRCYVRLFESYRIPFDRDRFQQTYSPEWYRTYAALGLPKECWDEADARWLDFYAAEENVMLGGAREALEALRRAGLALGIVTSGSGPRVAREMEGLGLRGLFGAVISADDVEKRKPDPEPIVRALELLGMPAAEAAYVGDSPEDVEMARAAGVYVIGVPGPFPNREQLKAAAPDLVCDSLGAAVGALLAAAESA